MSAQVHSGQTEGRRKTFLEWTSINLSSKLSLTCGGNVNYYTSVHHPIPTLPVGIGNTLNTSHKFWDISPSPHYQCCLQISETVSWHKLRRCYFSSMLQHWAGERDLIYFWKVDHSRIFLNFSRNWLGLNNLCEILLALFKTNQ